MRLSQAHGLALVAGRAALEVAGGPLDGEAKVQYLDNAIPVQTDVLRLDVAVDDVKLLVEDADCHGQLGQEVPRQFRLDVVKVVGVEAGKVAALDVLTDHQDLVVPLQREEELQEVVLCRVGVEQPQDGDLLLGDAIRTLYLGRPLHHDRLPVELSDRVGAEDGEVADGEAAAPDDVRELHGDGVRLEHALGADPQWVHARDLGDHVLGTPDRARHLGASDQGLGRHDSGRDGRNGLLRPGKVEWDVGVEVDVILVLLLLLLVLAANISGGAFVFFFFG